MVVDKVRFFHTNGIHIFQWLGDKHVEFVDKFRTIMWITGCYP